MRSDCAAGGRPSRVCARWVWVWVCGCGCGFVLRGEGVCECVVRAVRAGGRLEFVLGLWWDEICG
jgi:hypothetical protein